MVKVKHKSIIRTIIRKWPGEKYFGLYRFLPVFFICGALLEFTMINWTVGQTNFYKVYKRRQAEKFVEFEKNL